MAIDAVTGQQHDVIVAETALLYQLVEQVGDDGTLVFGPVIAGDADTQAGKSQTIKRGQKTPKGASLQGSTA